MKLKNKFQGEKKIKRILKKANLLKKSELYADLLETTSYLSPQSDEQQIFMLAHLQLLAITNTKQLKLLVDYSTNEAINKAKEVSALNAIFNQSTNN